MRTGGRGADPLRPGSVWREADNDSVNVLRPSVKTLRVDAAAERWEGSPPLHLLTLTHTFLLTAVRIIIGDLLLVPV